MKLFELSWKYFKVVVPLAMAIVPVVVLANLSVVCSQATCTLDLNSFALGGLSFFVGLLYMANNHEKQIFGVENK